jgi:hypothetical protein
MLVPVLILLGAFIVIEAVLITLTWILVTKY